MFVRMIEAPCPHGMEAGQSEAVGPPVDDGFRFSDNGLRRKARCYNPRPTLTNARRFVPQGARRGGRVVEGARLESV